MLRRHPDLGAQEVAPKWFPGDRDLRKRESLLPKRIPPELREVLRQRGARGSRAVRVSGGGSLWRQDPRRGSPHPLVHQVTDTGVGVESLPRLRPAASNAAPRAARRPAVRRPLLLPPLFSAGAPRSPRPPRWGDPWRDLDGEASRSLGAQIGELLARKFREFLSQLGAEREEPRPPQTSSASQHQGGVAENGRGSAQCPDCSFLPDLPCQPSYFQELSLLTDSLKKILLHQTPVLGPLRGGHSQFTTIRKAHERPHSTQAPKPKAVLTHSSSGEGSGPRRRCCPFRVRFADETLRDTALRYWERSCVVQQCLLKDQAASQSAAAEQVFGGVGRWLESLPRVLRPKAKKEKATASSLPTQELQGCLSENVSMASSLPFIPRATTQGQRGDLHTYPDAHDILEQVGKSPPSWSQKLESFLPKLLLQSVLKRSHSKGYQLLLPSATAQRAQR
ncbi:uncharacterized protein C9orf50 homolog [Tamandua tetradactyla]|uniref:uncharacterized protein C9orf50 homolog n=1 Tax=Tamandua tetradactyla TaxID=48850 RepID=UPI004053D21C